MAELPWPIMTHEFSLPSDVRSKINIRRTPPLLWRTRWLGLIDVLQAAPEVSILRRLPELIAACKSCLLAIVQQLSIPEVRTVDRHLCVKFLARGSMSFSTDTYANLVPFQVSIGSLKTMITERTMKARIHFGRCLSTD